MSVSPNCRRIKQLLTFVVNTDFFYSCLDQNPEGNNYHQIFAYVLLKTTGLCMTVSMGGPKSHLTLKIFYQSHLTLIFLPSHLIRLRQFGFS